MAINEFTLLYLACGAYGLGFVLTYVERAPLGWRKAFYPLAAGLVVHSASIAVRWERVGHGPFINLYEILSSNLWSLMLAYLLFLPWAAKHRQAGKYVVPLLAMLMLWLLLTTARDTYLPSTYDTVWLYFHVVSGKIFLGLLMLSAAVAIVEARRRGAMAAENTDSAVASASYRLLAFAFVFETMMLMFGAIWAQDAWGRYWAWDPLETWAFLTWLSVVFVLHWRLKYSHRALFAALVGACFVLAFLTFFGVPFISTAPHKGMI